MSSSLNCQVAPLSSILTESSNKNSISQTQPANIMYFSIIPNNNINNNNNTSPNPIRKRKVKFMIQLAIEELLSVPYLNGVLFCKVRLCDGGHYVSYSSKKEVSNSSVLWSNDAPIQFEVKTTQYYQYTTAAPGPCVYQEAAASSQSSAPNNFLITGYEPCLCRISVRKELRGGKSYQKLGYVDCNLTDFIYKYQQENNQLIQAKNNAHLQPVTTALASSVNSDEFCVNRILKEYDVSHISSKKNQQRLDNSYLKIKIKIIDTNQAASQNSILSSNRSKSPLKDLTASRTEIEKSASVPCSPKQKKSLSPSITFSGEGNNNLKCLADQQIANRVLLQPSLSNQTQSPEMTAKSQLNSPLVNHLISTHTNFTPSHSRNSSSSTTNSTIHPTNCLTTAFVNGHYRSCSNGSIKSNVSFDFLIKNRNKKLLEEGQSTSSPHINNTHHSHIQSAFDHNTLLSKLSNYSTQTKIEPPSSNLQIIETRVDANEIINQIENDLTNRINNIKSNK